MLGRLLDDTYAPEVRANITLVTVARLTANSAYRFIIPFLAVIADGLDVSLSKMGLALTVGELTGLTASFIGRGVDRSSRKGTMVVGLVGLAAGSVIAGTAPGLLAFTGGLVVIALGKFAFDLSLLSWIADHVPAARRGRVIGITETSWALSLFVGVPILGAVTALSSWRWAYGVVALAVTVLIVATLVHLPADTVHHSDRAKPVRTPIGRRGMTWILSVGMLMLASQLMFVTLGPWLEDEHGFSAGGISAVAFALGAVELVSSIGATRLTDRWGGRRSVTRGGVLIVPATLLFAAGHEQLVVGLFAFGLMVLGFEYAIISAVSVATGLMPGSPAAGIGMMVTIGTVLRASGSAAGTWLYEHHGATIPALLSTIAAVVMVTLSLDRLSKPVT